MKGASVCLLLCLLAAGFRAGDAQAQIIAADRTALLSFVNTATGDNSSVPFFTNEKGNLCDPAVNNGWVQCNDLGQVTTFKIENNAYQFAVGHVNESLGKLTHVTAVLLAATNLNGPVPASFGQLTSMQKLKLNGNPGLGPFGINAFNGMTGLELLGVGATKAFYNTKKLPAALGSLHGLTKLDVSATHLTGPIPTFLGGLTNLTNLYLGKNNFTNGIPPVLGKLKALQILHLGFNPFLGGSIPKELANLESMLDLELQSLGLEGPLPKDLFTNLTNLQLLDMSDNVGLTGFLPTELGGIPGLNAGNVMLKGTSFLGPVPVSFADARWGGLDILLDPQSSLCSTKPGEACKPETTALLGLLEAWGFPQALINGKVVNWKGSSPCALVGQTWSGITCVNGEVTALWLPNKGLTGTLADVIGNLTALTTINLSGNNLTGPVPKSLTELRTLISVDLSDNQFTGDEPVFAANVLVSLAGNKFTAASPALAPSDWRPHPADTPSPSPTNPNPPPTLRGVPSPPGTVPGPPDTGAAAPPPTRNGTYANGLAKKSSSTFVYVLAGLGVLVVLTLLAVCCCTYGSRTCNDREVRSRNGEGEDEEDLVSMSPGDRLPIISDGGAPSPNSMGNCDAVRPEMTGRTRPVMAPANNILLQSITEATNNFAESNYLGKGGSATVYKGVLDGRPIAVKRMVGMSRGVLAQFDAEILTLTQLRHRHLVSLLGHCVSGQERLLVYEYVSQGPLSRYLDDKTCHLGWRQRVTVVLDVAEGLKYLHRWAPKSIIHRDLKPGNILLDDDFRAKVADFGLAKETPTESTSVLTSNLCGTRGYWAPESRTGFVTTKVDVYSFGVVLMQIISGRPALDTTHGTLVDRFAPAFGNEAMLWQMVDRSVRREMVDRSNWDALVKTAELAHQCTLENPHGRPKMGECVKVLEPLVQQWQQPRPSMPSSSWVVTNVGPIDRQLVDDLPESEDQEGARLMMDGMGPFLGLHSRRSGPRWPTF